MADRRARNVSLIGYRGSGKTTVGRVLAERLNWSFVDTDAMIESEAHMTIADIFAAEGETGFRAREHDAIARVAVDARQVIAAGGGAVIDQRNVEFLKSAGPIVWLTACAEVLWARIEADRRSTRTRPDLTPLGGLEEVQAMLAKRQDAYRAAADLTVDTGSPNAAEVSVKILVVLEDWGYP